MNTFAGKQWIGYFNHNHDCLTLKRLPYDGRTGILPRRKVEKLENFFHREITVRYEVR